jgi:GDPmannose 4,6-dehydratase
MHPVSPYGCAKLFGYNITKNYRKSYNLFVSNGILFNHESPRRGTNFVTNKVVKEAVRIYYGQSNELKLGNLEATRDWGHAKDYVEAMWRILQLEQPDDFVCATGISHSVKDLCEYVFTYLGLNYQDYVKIDEKYLRPEELKDLKGDSTKLRQLTGWEPEYSFESMLNEMIEHWIKVYNKK